MLYSGKTMLTLALASLLARQVGGGRAVRPLTLAERRHRRKRRQLQRASRRANRR